MTDTWLVYRTTETFNQATGQYDAETTTVYSGPGKLQTFEAYEQDAEAAAHVFTLMRQTLHLPVNEASALVAVDDTAVCTASATDSALVGVEVRVAGVLTKTFKTARRFPVEEVVA